MCLTLIYVGCGVFICEAQAKLERIRKNMYIIYENVFVICMAKYPTCGFRVCVGVFSYAP